MALVSMTGFGRGSARQQGMAADVELSSVNRRQFELRMNLPRPLAFLEARVQEELRKRISRGSVSGAVHVHVSDARRGEGVCVDAALAGAWVRRLRQAAKAARLSPDLDARVLLELPGVVSVEDPADQVAVMEPLVMAAVGRALQRLLAMKQREGRNLERELRKRLAGLSARASSIRKRAPGVPVRHREVMRARLAEAGIDLAASEALAREVALFADRCDISEELDRLESHFQQAEEFLSAGEPAGRSLDFLCQEMFREINTIGSKANDAAITRVVIRFKAELESLREQVQNVE